MTVNQPSTTNRTDGWPGYGTYPRCRACRLGFRQRLRYPQFDPDRILNPGRFLGGL